MNAIPIEYYLILSAFMFITGVTGVLIRKNAIVVFMCIELMLNAANLSLVTFSSYMGNAVGQIFVFFVMTVAAAEAAVGLAIIISVFRNKLTVNIDEINIFKW
ncbi:MAG: NADH-quinone oxidoreductase subunit NuoK [Bacteroidota bacterium]